MLKSVVNAQGLQKIFLILENDLGQINGVKYSICKQFFFTKKAKADQQIDAFIDKNEKGYLHKFIWY